MTRNILIVDDQKDVRRILRTGLESLKADLKVIDVPSGEEALLVISRQPVDLLVSDVRLPGITGLELKKRAVALNPNLKLILITGVSDRKTQREAAEAGANAFFLKPIEILEFLQAVEHCLNLTGVDEPPKALVKSPPVKTSKNEAMPTARPSASPGLPEFLDDFRREIAAEGIALVNVSGKILAQVGKIPSSDFQAKLIASTSEIFKTDEKVSALIRANSKAAGVYHYFNGAIFDICLVRLTNSMAVLALLSPSLDFEAVARVIRAMPALISNLLAIVGKKEELLPSPVTEVVEKASGPAHEPVVSLSKAKEPVGEPVPEPVPEPTPQELEEVLPALDQLFSQIKKEGIGAQDIDAFWDDVAENESDLADKTSSFTGEILTYEEARKLGLAP